MAKAAQFSINFIRNIVYFAAGLGVPPESICRTAGFPVERLSTPDEMVAGDVVARVWQVALAETGNAHLGLHVGEALQPQALGLIGFAMLSCTTLGAALEKMARYWNLMSNATSIGSRNDGRTATLTLVVHDLPGNFLLTDRHPVESSLSAAAGLARALAGRPLPLVDVASEYPDPANASEYERIFGRRPRFSAEANLVSFPAEALGWPVLYANPAMQETFEAQIRKRLEADPQTSRERVRIELAKRLRGELPDLPVVARALQKSERALQRELQLEGTTFREVLDDLRRDLAMEYLQDGLHSITDIAFLLGFSEPSVLHRYCKRWLGMTPREFQRRP